MTKDTLFQQIQAANQEIKAYGVTRLGLFGSHLRNEATPGSDIDLLVEFSTGKKTYDNFMHLAFFLEELFHNKVDLLTPAGLSTYIKPQVMGEVEFIEIG